MNKPRSILEKNPLAQLTWARLLEFVRSPGVIFWVFGFPVLLAIALGLAFRNQPPVPARVAVIGKAAPAVSSILQETEGVALVGKDRESALAALRAGRLDIIVIAQGTAQKATQITYRYDPTREECRTARLVLDNALQRASGRSDPVAVTEEPVTEVGGRYIDFLIPGLIGLNIMGSCMWGIGYAVVDARKRKLLKRFAATPMHRSHFLLSFMLSRLVFLIVEVIVLAVFGYLAFDVQVVGSMTAIAVIAAIGAFAFSGLAVLIAARPESTEVASGWMNFTMLPMWLLSGSFFAYDRFPDVLHPFIRMLPLTALNDSLRFIINDGASLAGVWSPVAVLLIWGTVGFSLALKLFRWQ
ncbi:MAG: ABC transporter permease [Myxococcota bacterium]|nr:ABC transporter permease [Myxococcota bacterium]